MSINKHGRNSKVNKTTGLAAKPYLINLSLKRDAVKSFEEYPFNIPAVRHLNKLEFHPDVTFFIGENGTGKSTLLEAIAMVMRFNPEGGSKNMLFSTKPTHSALCDYIQISRSYKLPKDGYFLRAESFYNVASYIDEIGYADAYGGKSLHQQSHGESFLSLLNHRFRGNGLYLLDEPEAALSPSRQMSALVVIDRLVKAHSQFIIATHSPIFMAYPRAKIYQFSPGGIDEVAYTDTEHYKVYRDFLNRHEQMLRYLLADS